MTQHNPGLSPRFAEEIAAITAPSGDDPPRSHPEFLEIWGQFAEGLTLSGVCAEIRPSGSGRSLSLMLWPPFRPAWRSIMLTFFLDSRGVTILNEKQITLASPAELKAWLRQFAGSSHFLNSLRMLREQAQEPVEATLELGEGPDIIVEVPASTQRALHQSGAADFTATVNLLQGEPSPRPGQALRLRSAGLEFSVLHATRQGQHLELSLARQL